jgi:hypothetical protein
LAIDPTAKAIDKARLRALISDISSMIESSGATEVYFVVAVPEASGGCRVVCADTGNTRFGKQALETFHEYLRNKSN